MDTCSAAMPSEGALHLGFPTWYKQQLHRSEFIYLFILI